MYSGDSVSENFQNIVQVPYVDLRSMMERNERRGHKLSESTIKKRKAQALKSIRTSHYYEMFEAEH